MSRNDDESKAPRSGPHAQARSIDSVASRELLASTTHFAKGLIIKGELTGLEDILIEGQMHGQIRMPESRVVVGSDGRVVAGIEAREIIVRGRVRGDLRGDRVQIVAGGSLIGDVVAQRIALEEGAELRGNLDTTRAQVPAIPPRRARAAAAAGATGNNSPVSDKSIADTPTPDLPPNLQAREAPRV